MNTADRRNTARPANSNTGPRHVAVGKTNGRYRLSIDGTEFFVRGAGGSGPRIDRLAAHGANSIRTWSTRDGHSVLDAAHKAGLMVLMGIRVGLERHGFDYDDEAAVAAQLDRITGEVLGLKNHPALLGWGIGNELNLNATNPAVWSAVNGIARRIHDVDGNHPTTTMLAGVRKETVADIQERAPDLDFLSVQMYGTVGSAKERIAAAGYDGPYLITEWGATGHWEVPCTEWGAPVEQTSSEKADAIVERYRQAIEGDAERCMGSYVFLWGQKQERTPTWYGLFTEDGKETEAIDAMHFVWTGAWPAHRAPRLTGVSIDGKGRYDSVRLATGSRATATLETDATAGPGIDVHAEVL
ncbi:MAG: hypothetical protein EA382_00935, partial [Spirochaetaceae bacterium]